MQARFTIGTKYIPVGRQHQGVCTVTDILRTYDNAGELVRIRYVSVHSFGGQMVADSDVSDATIARGLLHSQQLSA